MMTKLTTQEIKSLQALLNAAASKGDGFTAGTYAARLAFDAAAPAQRECIGAVGDKFPGAADLFGEYDGERADAEQDFVREWNELACEYLASIDDSY